MIEFRFVPNQFSREGRESWVEPATDQTLAEAIPEKYRSGYKIIHSRIGKVEESEWATTVLKNGDEVVIAPDIGIIAALFYLFGATLQTVIGLALAEASVYWSMYEKRKAKKAARANRGGGSMESSPTFGWDGIHTTASASIPVPIMYGTHAVGGNFINTFIYSRGDTNYLCLLIALSEGPVEAIANIYENVDHIDSDDARIGDSIKISGNPIGNYPNIWVSTRLGASVQNIIPSHEEVVDGVNQGVVFPGFELEHSITSFIGEDIDYTPQTTAYPPGTPGTNVHTTAEGVDVDSVWIGIKYPGGLYHIEIGGLYGETQLFRIEYKLHAESTWIVHTNGYVINARSTSPIRRQVGIVFTADGTLPEDGGVPTPGRYDIRITKLSKDSQPQERQADAEWDYLDEIQHKKRTYPYTALLGLVIPATSQLSGGLPNIEVEVRGRKISAPDFKIGAAEQDWEDVYWNTDDSEYQLIDGGTSVTSSGFRNQHCANPIWILMDLLQHTRYGLGRHITAASLNLSEFHVGSRYCDTLVDTFEGDETDVDWRRGFRFDGPLDETKKAFDGIELILDTVGGHLIWSGGFLAPFIDRTADPTQLFGMGSIREGTFKELFLPKRAAYNANEMQYLDKTNGYTRETLVVQDATALANDDPVNKRVLFLPGVTRRSQIVRFGTYLTNLDRLTIRTIKFEAGIEGVICQVGDVISVAHDLPVWGVSSGRITGGTSNTFFINRTVTLDVGETYYVQVRHNADDSIEEQEIGTPAGTYAPGVELELAGADTFDTTPVAYDTFSIGKQNVVTKPFRVTKMSRADENNVAIDAVEYNANIYTDDADAIDPPTYSDLPIISAIPDHVTDLSAENSSGWNSSVYVSWGLSDATANYSLYAYAKVYINPTGLPALGDVNDPDWLEAGTTERTNFTIQNLMPDTTYGITVIAYGINGKHATWNTADFIEITVKTADVPPNVRGLELKGQGNDTEFVGKDAVFTWNESSIVGGWDHTDPDNAGAGGGTRDTYFQDYRIEIWDTVAGTYGKLREEVGILQPEYIYTYEKNLADLSNVPNRSFEIKVWGRDIYNRSSTEPAVLSVSNPQCATPTEFGASATGRTIFLFWEANSERDIVGYQIRRSKTPNFVWANGDIVYTGRDTTYADYRADADPPVTTYYYRIAAYDSFGQDSMSPTSAIFATTAYIPPEDTGWETPVPVGMEIIKFGAFTIWNTHEISFKGVRYDITGDTTASNFVTWTVGDSTYTAYDTLPSIVDQERFLIFTSAIDANGPDSCWNKVGYQSIDTVHLNDGAVDTDKLGDLAATKTKMDFAGVYVRGIGNLETLFDYETSGGITLLNWYGPDYLTTGTAREYQHANQRMYYDMYVDHISGCATGSHPDTFKAQMRLVRVNGDYSLTQMWIGDWFNFTLTSANIGTTVTIASDEEVWPTENGLAIGDLFIPQIQFGTVTSGSLLTNHADLATNKSEGGFESDINEITQDAIYKT